MAGQRISVPGSPSARWERSAARCSQQMWCDHRGRRSGVRSYQGEVFHRNTCRLVGSPFLRPVRISDQPMRNDGVFDYAVHQKAHWISFVNANRAEGVFLAVGGIANVIEQGSKGPLVPLLKSQIPDVQQSHGLSDLGNGVGEHATD